MQMLRQHKRRLMTVVLVAFVVLMLIMSLASVLYRSDLRYERGPYSVSKNGTTTFCTVTNNGRRTAEKSRMFVDFESKILDIRFSPRTAGELVRMASDGRGALLELGIIGSGDGMGVSLPVERVQNTPFYVQLLDISADIPLGERAVPLR